MKIIRHLGVAIALTGLVGAAQAGGLDDPIIAPEIIIEDTVPSGHDVLVPIVALILVGVAVAAGD